MVDLATRPVQAGRPQTLVEAAQTFVERPILLGTRFEIPGVGRGLTPATDCNRESTARCRTARDDGKSPLPTPVTGVLGYTEG